MTLGLERDKFVFFKLCVLFVSINHLKPGGKHMYHQLKHYEILHVAVRLIYVFRMNLIKKAYYFHQHSLASDVFNLLKPTGYVMHQQFNIQQLYVLPTLYLCVLYLSENKQRLVPLTA